MHSRSRSWRLLQLLPILALPIIRLHVVASVQPPPFVRGERNEPQQLFIASMFSGPSFASPTSGLELATSTNGVTFTNILGPNASHAGPLYTVPGGVRDPSLLRSGDSWYVVLSFAANKSSTVLLAASSDLRHWRSLGNGLPLAPLAHDNYVDVPQLIATPDGGLHIIGDLDGPEQWVEVHLRNASTPPERWGDSASWTTATPLRDHNGVALNQDNTFVAQFDGTFYMAYDKTLPGSHASRGYYMRTSDKLSSGWSPPRKLTINSRVNNGDAESLVFFGNGTMRFYISDGNVVNDPKKKHRMWCTDSSDFGSTWSEPSELNFVGFRAPGINWSQVLVTRL